MGSQVVHPGRGLPSGFPRPFLTVSASATNRLPQTAHRFVSLPRNVRTRRCQLSSASTFLGTANVPCRRAIFLRIIAQQKKEDPRSNGSSFRRRSSKLGGVCRPPGGGVTELLGPLPIRSPLSSRKKYPVTAHAHSLSGATHTSQAGYGQQLFLGRRSASGGGITAGMGVPR